MLAFTSVLFCIVFVVYLTNNTLINLIVLILLVAIMVIAFRDVLKMIWIRVRTMKK